MRQSNLSEARRLLPRLVDEVRRSGKSIQLTRHGKPVAMLSACPPPKKSSVDPDFPLRGLGFEISDDFDEPMTELWEALINR